MPFYKLRRKFYDGRGTVHPVGDVVEFEEGQAPSSAVPVDGPQPAKKAKGTEPSALSEVDDEPELDLGDEPKALSELSKAKKK